MAERGRVGCVVVGDGAGESVIDSRNCLTSWGEGGGELSVIVMIRRVWNKVVGCIKDGAGKQGGASLYKCIEGGEGMTVGRGQTINSSRCRSENVDFDAINALSSLPLPCPLCGEI